MLVELFAVMLIMSFMLFVMAVEEESLVYSMLSLVFWATMLPQALLLTDIAENTYYEYGVSALCLAFIFASLVLVIINQKKWKSRERLP